MNQSNSSKKDYAVIANRIAAVLSETPMTAAEINTALGEEYTPLQIANAVKFISGASATRVRRMVRNTRGFQMEKEYAAYSLNGSGVVQKFQKPVRPQGNGTSAPRPSKLSALYKDWYGECNVCPPNDAKITNVNMRTDVGKRRFDLLDTGLEFGDFMDTLEKNWKFRRIKVD